MGFPVIFLKHVVPSLNRTSSTTITNNNNNNKKLKNLYYLANRRASCSRRGGQVKICKVRFFIFIARLLLHKPSGVRPVKLQILHNYNVFYRDSINPQCVVGSPVNLLCTSLWETVETIYNIYIYTYIYENISVQCL